MIGLEWLMQNSIYACHSSYDNFSDWFKCDKRRISWCFFLMKRTTSSNDVYLTIKHILFYFIEIIKWNAPLMGWLKLSALFAKWKWQAINSIEFLILKFNCCNWREKNTNRIDPISANCGDRKYFYSSKMDVKSRIARLDVTRRSDRRIVFHFLLFHRLFTWVRPSNE